MARVKERPTKSALDTLQDWLSGGGQALVESAQTIQRLVSATGRGVEEQVGSLLVSLEQTLREQIDQLVNGIAVSIRGDVENVREEVQELREQLLDPNDRSSFEQLLEPLRALANGALERAAYAQTRLAELAQRLEHIEFRDDPNVRLADLERRLASIDARLSAALQANDEAARERSMAEQLGPLEQRVREMRVEIGERTSDLPSMRERLTKIEARVLETSKEQIARAGEATSLRDRLARLEARLTDLSREQVARAVEAAGLRERVFRIEQRAGAYGQAATEPGSEGEHSTG
jgi:chromosome segregation ATPase